MAEVMLTNATKQFGDFAIVDDITVKIEAGKFIVLADPFGCGKTTTLKMVASLERVTDGETKIGDRVVNHASPQDRGITVAFQNTALYPHMDIIANMLFGL